MDHFAAATAEEIMHLRSQSAGRFGAMFFEQAVRELAARCGPGALDRLQDQLAAAVDASPETGTQEVMLKQLAVEELERAIQQVRNGHSELRGWTEDAPPSVEETKA